jgi:hypothetical protein
VPVQTLKRYGPVDIKIDQPCKNSFNTRFVKGSQDLISIIAGGWIPAETVMKYLRGFLSFTQLNIMKNE